MYPDNLLHVVLPVAPCVVFLVASLGMRGAPSFNLDREVQPLFAAGLMGGEPGDRVGAAYPAMRKD